MKCKKCQEELVEIKGKQKCLNCGLEEEKENTDITATNRSELYQESYGGKFKKGNPGKPKGSLSLTGILKKKLEDLKTTEGRQVAEQLMENIIQDALEHNDRMRELIWNYVDGKPKQSLEISEVDGINSERENIFDEK
jgi:hypothetical protein